MGFLGIDFEFLKGIPEKSGVDLAISQFWENLQELRDLLIGCDSTMPE